MSETTKPYVLKPNVIDRPRRRLPINTAHRQKLIWSNNGLRSKILHKHDGSDKVPIYVVYGKDEEIYVSDFGGYNWKTENPPTPIGIFTVTSRTIRPVKKNDFNKDHADCLEWMLENISNIEKSIEISKE